MSVRGGVVLTVIAAALALGVPGAARAAPETSVTLYSDPGDWVGGGGQWVLTPADADITVDGYNAYLWVEAFDRDGAGYARFEFAAPKGQLLAPGVYEHAMRAPFREDGRPGLDIGVDRYGCDDVEGRFEVKAIDVRPDGLLRKLWIVFEQHCDGTTPGVYGEVRIGMPGSTATFTTAPALVRWPLSELERTNTTVAIRLVASARGELRDIGLEGADAAHFRIADNGCSGRILDAGDTCVVRVAYRPAAPGTRTATLRLTDAAGRARTVALEGFSYGGRTRLELDGDRGHWISQGKDWSFSAADGLIATGSGNRLDFGMPWNNEHDTFGGGFIGPGGVLTPGTYTDASPNWWVEGESSLSVSATGRGCHEAMGWFTIDELAHDRYGQVQRTRVRFEHRCGDYSNPEPRMRGLLEFRAGDTSQPPAWTGPGPGATGAVIDIDGVAPPDDDEEAPPPDDGGTLPSVEAPGSHVAPPDGPAEPRPVGSRAPAPTPVDARGRLRLLVRCPAHRARCHGTIRLHVNGRTAALRRFALRQHSGRVRVVLRPWARTLVRRAETPVDARLTTRMAGTIRRATVRLAVRGT